MVALAGPTPRSDLVLAAVDLLLRGAGLTPGDLQALVVTRGPGSFTGVRVALATVQGIAMGAAVPAHGFGSLLAQAARSEVAPVLAVQPARRGEVYAQPFERVEGVLHPGAAPITLPLLALADSALPVVAPAGLELPPAVPLAPVRCSTAEALLDLAASLPACDGTTVVPLYVDPPPAVPPAPEA
jgi:tRNA threonylcarbamoyl adenosine modification protein YeaZ